MLSAFEMAEGYTKPLSDYARRLPIPEHLTPARDTLLANRKLNQSLCLHPRTSRQVSLGDMVQVFGQNGKENLEK